MAKRKPKVARVMHVKMKKSKLRTAMKLWGPRTAGYKKQKGFHSGYMLVNPKTGEVLSITLWHSMAAVRANERGPYMKKAVSGFHAFFAKKPYSTYHKVGAAVQ